MKFFTSDLHFWHKNVIKYSNRPFANVEEMNEAIIKGINDTVGVDDELYILGDFAFANKNKIKDILFKIKCKNLHYIYGNHDEDMYHDSIKEHFLSMQDYLELSVPDKDTFHGSQKIILFHYPILEWNGGHRGAWMLHGHCHGNLKLPEMLKKCRIMDIGTDCCSYKPISYEEIKTAFKNKEDIKHHGD